VGEAGFAKQAARSAPESVVARREPDRGIAGAFALAGEKRDQQVANGERDDRGGMTLSKERVSVGRKSLAWTGRHLHVGLTRCRR
jgi:hypothetical protein